jgi:hypothetical protein
VIEFLRAHWKKLLAVALVAGAFAVGRYTTPGPDVVIAQSIRFVERKVEVVKVEKAKTRIVYRNVEVKPDGTKIDRSVETTETETKRDSNTSTDRDNASSSTSTVTAYKPQWRVGALVGVDGGTLVRNPLNPSWSLLSVGAFAERRIAGPFFVGVWGLSTGPSFGLTLSVEF